MYWTGRRLESSRSMTTPAVGRLGLHTQADASLPFGMGIGANFSFVAPSSEESLTHSLTHTLTHVFENFDHKE